MNERIFVRLPWDKPPQSLNDRQHFRVKAEATSDALASARWAIRAAKVQLPTLPIYLVLHFRLPNNRNRDTTNLAQVLKVVEDALVHESKGQLPDDGWKYVRATGQEIHPPDPRFAPGLWLEIGAYHGGLPFSRGVSAPENDARTVSPRTLGAQPRE